MSAMASIRDLRNSFPKVRKLLERDGEVLLTERGRPKYRLTPHIEARSSQPAPVDYWVRLNATQPNPLTAGQSQALIEENRGDR